MSGLFQIPLDLYIARQSPIHKLSAGFKLIIAVGLVIVTALTPGGQWGMYAAVGSVLVLLVILSRVPVIHLVKRVLFFEPFILGIAVLTLLQPHGLAIFLAIVTKTTLCLFFATLLAATTPFSDSLIAMQRLHVPQLLITTLTLTYRYLFLLVDEAGRMRQARKSRTFSGKRTQVWYLLSTIIAQLFIRSSLRAERIYAAMCARGWKA